MTHPHPALSTRSWAWVKHRAAQGRYRCFQSPCAHSEAAHPPTHPTHSNRQDPPFLWLGVHRVPQGIVGVIFESHPRSRVPLGVFLAKALFGVGAQPQLLALPQLDDEDVCGERWESAAGQERRSPPGADLECHWKATDIRKSGSQAS